MADTVRAGIPADFTLAKGDGIKFVADANSNGKVWLLPGHGGKGALDARVIAAGATVLLGAYNYATRIHVECYAGTIVCSKADELVPTPITQAAYNALIAPDANTLYVING